MILEARGIKVHPFLVVDRLKSESLSIRAPQNKITIYLDTGTSRNISVILEEDPDYEELYVYKISVSLVGVEGNIEKIFSEFRRISKLLRGVE